MSVQANSGWQSWLNSISQQGTANQSNQGEGDPATGFHLWQQTFGEPHPNDPNAQQQPQAQSPQAQQPTQSGGMGNGVAGAAIYDKLFGTSAAGEQAAVTDPAMAAALHNAPSAAPGAFSLSNIGAAGNAILPAAGALGAWNLANAKLQGNQAGYARGALQGGASGAALGSFFGPVGAAIGGGIGINLGLAKVAFGSHKSQAQKERDSLRKPLLQNGVVDNNYNLNFSDKSSWNMGADKGATFNGMDGVARRYWQIDDSNPLWGQAIGFAQPLAQMAAPGQENNMVAWYANALQNGTKDINVMKQRAAELYQKFGLDKDSANAQVDDLLKKGVIKDDVAAAYRNAINQLNLPSAQDAANAANATYSAQMAAADKQARQQSVAGQMMSFAQQQSANNMALASNRPNYQALQSQTSSQAPDASNGFSSFENAISNVLLK